MREEQYIHVNQNGDKFYYADNKMVVYHRTDGPAAEYAYGTKKWYVNGVLHHTDGPAIEWANGDKVWYVNGLRHRVDGPAVEYADGDKEWYLNDKLHRVDGPAVEGANGAKEWYVNGVKHTEKEFDKIMHPQSVELTLEQIAAKFGLT